MPGTFRNKNVWNKSSRQLFNVAAGFDCIYSDFVDIVRARHISNCNANEMNCV